MKPTPTIAIVLCVVILLIVSHSLYRRKVICRQRGAALSSRLEQLRRDADEQLTVGTKKDALIHFCERHRLTLSLTSDEAVGDFSEDGCAPFGCGKDTFTGGLRIKVDREGTVIGKPYVGGIYIDCL